MVKILRDKFFNSIISTSTMKCDLRTSDMRILSIKKPEDNFITSLCREYEFTVCSNMKIKITFCRSILLLMPLMKRENMKTSESERGIYVSPWKRSFERFHFFSCIYLFVIARELFEQNYHFISLSVFVIFKFVFKLPFSLSI